MNLSSLRDEFPILATTTYMISNSLGAMPRGVEASLAEYAATWASRRRTCVGGAVVDDGKGGGRCGGAVHRRARPAR